MFASPRLAPVMSLRPRGMLSSHFVYDGISLKGPKHLLGTSLTNINWCVCFDLVLCCIQKVNHRHQKTPNALLSHQVQYVLRR